VTVSAGGVAASGPAIVAGGRCPVLCAVARIARIAMLEPSPGSSLAGPTSAGPPARADSA
jgi:hypothetical protein